jgi:hypothetical protein
MVIAGEQVVRCIPCVRLTILRFFADLLERHVEMRAARQHVLREFGGVPQDLASLPKQLAAKAPRLLGLSGFGILAPTARLRLRIESSPAPSPADPWTYSGGQGSQRR